MPCTACASECLCAVISGDSVISVTGVGSGAVPYTVTANICNGLSAITVAGRNVLDTDKAVVIDGTGACKLVTVPEVCGVPAGGATNQTLMKASGDDCDLEWKTPPYVRVSLTAGASLTTGTPEIVSFDTADSDPVLMWDALVDPTVVTVPWDGWWSFGAQCTLTTEPGADGQVTLKMVVDDGVTPVYDMLPSVTLLSTVADYASSGTVFRYLTTGTTIALSVEWNSTTTPTTATVNTSDISMWGTWHNS